MGFDPLLLETFWSRLVSTVEQQAVALIRTSFTPSVAECGDLSACVFDPRGYMLAQAVTGTPGHINSMARCIMHVLDEYPAETLEPGDVIMSVDQQPVKTPQEAAEQLKQAAANGNILLLLNRHGTSQFVGLSVQSPGSGSSKPN